MGFVISIDDFGTGYSSLSYLNKLPVDILKIDRTFINNITEVGTSPVVEFMVNIASQLKLDVIVEGVETIKQRDIVKEYGCKYAQGYLYSKPLSITDLIDYIKNEKKDKIIDILSFFLMVLCNDNQVIVVKQFRIRRF